MKWVAISGSWRHTPLQLKIDLKNEITSIIAAGNGIVTGGALGVDYLATQLVMQLEPSLRSLQVILPTGLEIYAKHNIKRAEGGVISLKQAKNLINQLKMVKKANPSNLVEDSASKTVDKQSYYSRNTTIVANADELIAFGLMRVRVRQTPLERLKY